MKHAIAMCQRLGVHTILDPAPAPVKALPRALFGVDVFTPNQSEGEILLGMERTHEVKTSRIADPRQVGAALLSRGATTVVLKLGSKGAMIVGRGGEIRSVRPFRVKVVDTTAAGDAFTAGLAVGHAEGLELPDAARLANAAGAVCCAGFGAQPSLPSRQDVEKLLVK